MLRTLRSRLILSHLLPLLIVIPLVGITFIYTLETRVILPGLSDELVTEAKMIAELAGEQPNLWQDQGRIDSQIFRLASRTKARLMFLDPAGILLASSDAADQDRLGQAITDTDISNAQKGYSISHIDYSRGLDAEVIDVFAPVFGIGTQVIGIVRMSYPYTTVYDELLQTRFIIFGVTALALLIGIGLGSFLAVTISTPIQQVSHAIRELARGNQSEKLEETGPEEIQSLACSTNLLFERLRHLEQARKQLLANLVHEIGRPLGALRSAIQALTQGAEKDPQLLADLTNGMEAETIRLQYLLNDLAHLHEQVFGSLELNRQVISTSSWLFNVLRPWEEAAHKKSLQWILEIPDNLSHLKVDPLRLAQAIENVASNAIKYTPKAGTVTISAGIENETFWVKVMDTGPGISHDEKDKIFTPFYRGDQKRRIKQGMGLGLSIALDVVLAHGGEISLDSTVGEGSIFTIWIPII
jgi:two-component system, OmpR family, sensor histidine kinase BaeS